MNYLVDDQVLFLTSYPPRECGIATYSRDLINAISAKFSRNFNIRVCALEDKDLRLKYPEEVIYTLDTRKESDYFRLAEEINANDLIKMVFIQHEFGLFGGTNGEYVFRLLFSIRKPVSVTFHTVLPHPDDKLHQTVKAISHLVESIVVLTKQSAKILSETYGIKSHKLMVIPHGTHLIKWKRKVDVKENYGLADKLVLSTFGLLSRNKSIETAIDAIPAIKDKFTNVLYLVLGKTHPGVVDSEGEKYRSFLEQKVRDLQLEDNVMFVNRYLDLAELLNYLRLTDIYLFTSNDPYQAVSGTFAYAMSCGCPIISTPIPHAVEMLANGGGCIVDFNKPDQMAISTTALLENRGKLDSFSRRGFQLTRASAWDNVAVPHARLFGSLISGKEELIYNYPKLTLKHICKLTDSKGIIQFADNCEPDIESGYTLDDNARALIALCMHYRLSFNGKDRELIGIYLKFIKQCQIEGGTFLNYVDKDGFHSEKNHYVNLEDSNGRALWALGVLISHGDILPENYISMAEAMLLDCLPWTKTLTSPRSIAFVIKGLYYFNLVRKKHEISHIIDHLAGRLISHYRDAKEADWKWFEAQLTYANAVIPEAVMMAYIETGNLIYYKTAVDSFHFLISKITNREMFKPISNRGWLQRGKSAQTFGEQPIDIAYTILALESFWQTTKNYQYFQLAIRAFDWFLGHNHLGQALYNPVTGGCHDGLEEHEININQGAESSICFALARMTMENMNNKIPIQIKSRPIVRKRKSKRMYHKGKFVPE